MNAERARRLRPWIAALFGIALIIPAPIATANGATSDYLLADSVDDYIGGGVRTELSDGNATFGFVLGALSPGEIKVSAGNASTNWSLSFIPAPGESLHVGHYTANSLVAYSPIIRVNANSNGCGASTIGWFTIQALEVDGSGNPLAFAVTFEQWCDNSIGPLVGMLRVNTTTPQALLSTPRANRGFGSVTTGEAATPRTFTLEALGDLAVAVSSVDIDGAAASDFPLTADGCTGASLDTGETCSFDIGFEPSAIGDRLAALNIAVDTPEAVRVLPLRGYGRIPTTTSVSVAPDSVYIPPGVRLIATVSPVPSGDTLECWYDDALVATTTPEAGTGFCLVPREVGTHAFRARCLGSSTYGDSESSELEFDVSSATAVELTAPASVIPAGVSITLTANVATASDLLYPGGSLVFRDATASTIIATRSIDATTPTQSITASFAAGSHLIEATYGGVDGILDGSTDSLMLTVLPDGTAPSTTALRHVPVIGGAQTASGRLPVRIAWTGSDNLSGIARYEVERRTDGGSWSGPTNVTSASYISTLAPGHDYRFRARAIDWAGNVGAWNYGATFRLRRYPEYASAARYVGTWKKVTAGLWWGGTAMKSSTSGSIARFTFTGRTFAWLADTGPTRGRAKIYVNGVYKANVDLYSSTQQWWKIGWAKTWTTSATRTIEIKALATPTRPRIDVDGFWVGT